MRRILGSLYIPPREIALIVIAMLTLVSAHWAAEELKAVLDHWLHEPAQPPAPLAHARPSVASVAAFLGLFLLLSLATFLFGRKVLPHTRWLQSGKSPPQRKNLVLFLSDLSTSPGQYQDGIPVGVQLTGNLTVDIKRLAQLKQQKDKPVRWLWEMPLRAVRHHGTKLERIILVCSPQSLRQVHWFQGVLDRYASTDLAGIEVQLLARTAVEGKGEVIELQPLPAQEVKHGGWDFEDFDSLTLAIRALLERLDAKGIPEEEIMIDFTAGQKPTSLVASLATLNSHVNAQYVQTNAPWEVIGYDLVYESPMPRLARE